MVESCERPELADELVPCSGCLKAPRVYWTGCELKAHCRDIGCLRYTETPLFEEWNTLHKRGVDNGNVL